MKFNHRPDGTADYVTMQGDVLDHIAFVFYGEHAENTVLLYENNVGLARQPQPFAAGIRINLPARPAPTPTAQVNLWD